MRIRPPEFETSICDAKYHVSLTNLPPPTVKSQSPCDSGWSQAPRRQQGHFAAECNRPKRDNRHRRDDKRADDRYKKEERYKRDEEDDERAVDRLISHCLISSRSVVQGERLAYRLMHYSRSSTVSNVLALNASIFTGLADVRKEVQEVNAKVNFMVSCVNDIQKNVEDTKEALSHRLLEFQSQAQENHNILHAQLSELVNYINRGGADKKGESRAEDLNSLRMFKSEIVL
ncbi:Gamma response protein isoform 1 [Dorcoceras hygrometricum]|uniref:Gamma response protein isoform 1 n=1 Tax=Dorcoceras hygrometricum TaxID=472368 RepID=A0A2Z7D944_9LAMI|nr:Gamma response protein isoform 1 [Dorcoceras hygrometricum]